MPPNLSHMQIQQKHPSIVSLGLLILKASVVVTAKIWKLSPISSYICYIIFQTSIWDEGGLCCIHYVVRLKKEGKKPQGTADII